MSRFGGFGDPHRVGGGGGGFGGFGDSRMAGGSNFGSSFGRTNMGPPAAHAAHTGMGMGIGGIGRPHQQNTEATKKKIDGQKHTHTYGAYMHRIYIAVFSPLSFLVCCVRSLL